MAPSDHTPNSTSLTDVTPRSAAAALRSATPAPPLTAPPRCRQQGLTLGEASSQAVGPAPRPRTARQRTARDPGTRWACAGFWPVWRGCETRTPSARWALAGMARLVAAGRTAAGRPASRAATAHALASQDVAIAGSNPVSVVRGWWGLSAFRRAARDGCRGTKPTRRARRMHRREPSHDLCPCGASVEGSA